ncbi:MAG: hypothetical protein A3F82_10960 [Deltaproteobacteria bacterium RIFCSPLOWO2_12_FULL_44_12]|nr:MAG: hypothetical protein A2712_08965 [Deltaproteobacteria bacterium RIFCSPHIGHO2_01_FULL_43_49]OGQ14534.1 MAG: hypothetical protein A3D22_08035 [Deltaproteobacteria bacterium RIFCSPHIGHO2_02_FULL_44_53]OGQ27920.1 MAG: hypothetical protein A3D98_06745 [Deltaproteobacteria bacterium RIFCSPHIGHO2_12_FULL_44_21]OGQ31132.1 MAG: hypothetical protein A2979_06795 [Deltaproteobacteria bacterium RIFCSPLOWO2_01_FULL_45_74]OGQ43123.1 MAG: hypothetical protein A3I70_00450 [Deltaproteobacteria bacterium 
MQIQFMSWRDAILSALQGIWMKILGKLPDVFAAVVVLFVGLFLAGLLGRLVRRMVEFTRLDTFLQETVGLGKLKQRGLEIHAAALIAWFVKWFFIIVTFIAVADILKWGQLTSFFEQVALYIPNVIITVLILLAGFILGGGLQELVVKSVKASTLPASSAGVIGTAARWAVIGFSIMASLTQLGIAADLIKILFTGFVGMLAVAGGLAFGLGGQSQAGQWLDKVRKEIKHQ